MRSSNIKYIGLDVHKEAISIAVLNEAGKLVMESIIETKASTLVQFLDGLRGELHVTLEEGTWAAWLYDVLKPHVREIVVLCAVLGVARIGCSLAHRARSGDVIEQAIGRQGSSRDPRRGRCISSTHKRKPILRRSA